MVDLSVAEPKETKEADILSVTLLKSVLTNYPDGVLIVSDKLHPIFHNNNVKAMLNTSSITTAISQLMQMVNCHDEVTHHMAYNQMFKIMEVKVANMKKRISEEEGLGKQIKTIRSC
jgi:hypothetical protein